MQQETLTVVLMNERGCKKTAGKKTEIRVKASLG